MSDSIDFRLPASEIPTHWVNLLADLGPPPQPAAASRHRSRSAPRTWRRCSRWR